MPVVRSCTTCQNQFELSESHVNLLAKFTLHFDGQSFEIPLPRDCPACRYQRRLSHRNERRMYKRACDFSGKSIISIYSKESPYTVYAPDVWWSDSYDPLQYGRDFDFTRPFFEQFAALERDVPKLAILNAQSENSVYTNYSAENKNCYLVVGTAQCEDCYYGYRISLSKDVMDSYDLYKGELCYDCSLSSQLYACRSCWNCHLSSDLILCHSCQGCDHCFGCVNLRNKRYYIFNQPYSEKDYFQKLNELRADEARAIEQFNSFRLQHPYRATRIINSENASGDDLLNCKNVRGFTLKLCEDVIDCHHGEHDKDCFDCNHFDNCSLQLNSSNLEQNYFVISGNLAWYMKEACYVSQCFHSQSVFGCTGLKKQKHCILNQQYSEKEYERLAAKIARHMQETGELGEYFPTIYSAFAYNETVAQDVYPLTKEEVQRRGFRWKEFESTEESSTDAKAFDCSKCGHSFKVIPIELKFYEKLNIPIPTLCFECRHQERMKKINPHMLRPGQCVSCQTGLLTSFAQQAPEKIYCEDCYLAAII